MIRDILAKNLKTLRKQKGMTQEELAYRAGLSTSAIQLIELGKRWPHDTTVLAISKVLKISPVILFKKKS